MSGNGHSVGHTGDVNNDITNDHTDNSTHNIDNSTKTTHNSTNTSTHNHKGAALLPETFELKTSLLGILILVGCLGCCSEPGKEALFYVGRNIAYALAVIHLLLATHPKPFLVFFIGVFICLLRLWPAGWEFSCSVWNDIVDFCSDFFAMLNTNRNKKKTE
jgi:hypothetical protein